MASAGMGLSSVLPGLSPCTSLALECSRGGWGGSHGHPYGPLSLRLGTGTAGKQTPYLDGKSCRVTAKAVATGSRVEKVALCAVYLLLLLEMLQIWQQVVAGPSSGSSLVTSEKLLV